MLSDPVPEGRGGRDEGAKPTDQKVLKQLGRGSLLGFSGNIIQLLLSFVVYGMITRYVSKQEFGYFSLSLGVANIFATFSCVGFNSSMPSFVACKRERGESSRVRSAVRASFGMMILASIFFMCFFLFSSDYLSTLFAKPGLSHFLRIFSLAIPFIASSLMVATYLQSFHNVRGKFYNDVLSSVARIALVGIVMFCSLDIQWVASVYVLSFIIVAVFLYAYGRKELGYSFFPELRPFFTDTISKELLVYSLPVLLSGIFGLSLLWADIFILGIFASAEQVGAYSAGTRLTRLLPFIFTTTGFIFVPIISKLFFQGRVKELNSVFHFTNKWLIIVSLPIFYVFFLAPEATMRLIFGSQYGADSTFFRILTAGFFTHILFGLSMIGLVAIGKNKSQLRCLAGAALSNVVLDFMLIPTYGALGASIASCLALLLNNVVAVIIFYKETGVSPFCREYGKIVAFCGAFLLGMSFLIEKGVLLPMKFEFLLLVIISPPLSVLLTKSFSVEDYIIFDGIKSGLLKKIR